MKTCVILGHLASDRTLDNYPVVQVCDECVQADNELTEGAQVLNSRNFDPEHGDSCEFCDKTYEDELVERQLNQN